MKTRVKKRLSILFFLVICGIVGFFIGYYLANKELSFYQVAILLVLLPVYFISHIAIHEAGHAICGYFTGYRLVSYRLFSHLWVWQEEGVVYRRQKVPGTLGQCLMQPPTYVSEKYPFKLYLLGGVLANLVSSLLVLALFPTSVYSFLFFVIGLLLALTNLIPLGFNDGMSLKLARNNQEVQYLLYLQFEINYQFSKGKTFDDLPKDYFEPLSAPNDNYFVTYHALIRYAYYLERFELEQARELLEGLWRESESLVPIYRLELKKELLFCLAILDSGDQRIEAIMNDKLVTSSLNYPLMGNKRILASYHYFVKEDWKTGSQLTQAALELVDKSPLKGDAILEIKLVEWLDEQAIIYINTRGEVDVKPT